MSAKHVLSTPSKRVGAEIAGIAFLVCISASLLQAAKPPVDVCVALPQLDTLTGTQVVIRDQILVGPNDVVLVNSTCPGVFVPHMTVWPSVIELVPEARNRNILDALRQLAPPADLSSGEVVVRASVAGQLVRCNPCKKTAFRGTGFGSRGTFPARLIVTDVSDIEVDRGSEASQLDVFDPCRLFPRMEELVNQRVAVKGTLVTIGGEQFFVARCPNGKDGQTEPQTRIIRVKYDFWRITTHLEYETLIAPQLEKRRRAEQAKERSPQAYHGATRYGDGVVIAGRLRKLNQPFSFSPALIPIVGGSPEQTRKAKLRIVLQYEATLSAGEPKPGTPPELDVTRRRPPPSPSSPGTPEECSEVSSLVLAAERGCEEVVKKLLEGGADPSISEGRNRSPMQEAAWAGHAGIVRMLLNAGVDPDGEFDGATPMCLAAVSGRVNVVETLLAAGASPNRLSGRECIPLINAASYGNVETINVLLRAGADVDVKDRVGFTALHEAMRRRYPTKAEALLEAGANPDVSYISGKPIILWRYADLEVLGLLIKYDADLNVVDRAGETALMKATKGGAIASVERLLAAGAKVNIQDNQGNTALIYAAQEGHLDVVKRLMEGGADPSIKNAKRQDAFDVANGPNAAAIRDALGAR